MNLNTKFEHKLTEEGRYNKWLDEGLFTADINSNKVPYSIVLPPPNVTGKLHIGHTWDVTLQDILIRYKKMSGFETMWIPGMDHAGIATQAKVIERLKEMGVETKSLTRDTFLEYAWKWKSEYADLIRAQWAKMGLSLDYSQEVFTLDEDVSRSVNRVFVKLYNEGLIYQGHRITNWDPVAQTALSDIEVIHKEVEGKFYHFKYLIDGENGQFLEVATTRPETIFADGAVAVHPDDKTLNHLVGKFCINPADKRLLPIIADEMVEIGFGSGAVKISGAHDINDFECCKRHPELEKPVVMNLDGTMNDLCLEFSGQTREDARINFVAKMKKEGYLIKIEDHVHNVGHSERSKAIVEPLLTKQWYVKMSELAKDTLDFQKSDDKINFFPERFSKTLDTWMENVNDWCISRQIWWGHQIPAWIHNQTGELYVGEEAPLDFENYTQDVDVLDTWFSSALWPFATTIWSDKPSGIEKFYPTSTLVTGYDIIFFWVSRMVFQGIHFTEKKPFNDVLIHGLIRDENGKKMSKSLGNGVDPIDVIEQYGADALRYTITTNSAPGQDLRYSTEKIEASWNYINKIWNISRFTLMNIDNVKTKDLSEFSHLFDGADTYIITRLNETISQIDILMSKYEFSEVARCLYQFVWDDFSSWYVELAKISLNGTDLNIKEKTQQILKVVLVDILKMLHPFIPFVTDKIHSEIEDKHLLTTQWPKVKNVELNASSMVEFKHIKEIIVGIRNLKQENNIAPSKELDVIIDRGNEFTKSNLVLLKSFGRISSLDYSPLAQQEVLSIIFTHTTIHIISKDLINKEEKVQQLEAQLSKVNQEIDRSLNVLSNERFTKNAPKDKLNSEVEKALEYIKQCEDTKQLLREFKSNILDTENISKLIKIIEELS